jgi:hypothetical protein
VSFPLTIFLAKYSGDSVSESRTPLLAQEASSKLLKTRLNAGFSHLEHKTTCARKRQIRASARGGAIEARTSDPGGAYGEYSASKTQKTMDAYSKPAYQEFLE